MKPNLRTTLLTLAFILYTSAFFAADLQICTSDLTTRILPGRLITLTPASTPLEPPGWITAMGPWTGFTGTNGCVTVSNLLGGAYRLTISGTPITSLALAVPTNAGLVNAWFCLTNATLSASNAPEAYTTTASDALFATKTWSLYMSNVLYLHSGGSSGDWGFITTNALTENLAASSNLAYAITAAASNLAYAIGANGTNLAYSLGANGTNFTMAASNNLRSPLVTLIYALGANSTNFTMAASNTLAAAGGGQWAAIATNALTGNLTTSSNIAAGGFQVNSNRIGLWDDGIWGTIDDGTSSDGVERMIFLNAPGITTDSSGITGYRMLFFNGPYLGDPGAFMPLTNSSMTSDDAAWLHDVRPQLFTNGALLNAPSNMLSLDTAQNFSAVKTLILSNRIVLTGAGAPGANGTYSNLVKDATWLIYVQGPSTAYVNSNGYGIYRCDDGSLTNWSHAEQSYYSPLPSGRYGGLTLEADPACTNCPVLWRDSLIFQRTNATLSNLSGTGALTNANQFQATNSVLTGLQNTGAETNLLAPGRGINFNTNTSTALVTMQLTNRITIIATNATSATLDFDAGTTWYSVPALLVTNLVLSPTNLVSGREVWVQFTAGNCNYNVTITNTAANAIHWAFNNSTNGSTSFTVTNGMNAELSIIVRTNSVIHAVYGHFR